MMPQQTQITAKPSLIIGLGGTGVKAATQIKKDLLEISGNFLPIGVRVLGFDTEKENRVRVGGWGKARQEGVRSTGPVQLVAGEYVYLGGNVSKYADRVKAGEDPFAGKWWNVREMKAHNVPEIVWNLNEGAGRYRQFGRIALFQNMSVVQGQISDALRKIRSQTNGSGVTIHIIGSLAGGTGAGLFLDIAYLARKIALNVQLTQVNVFGYFALVDAFQGTPVIKLNNPVTRLDFDARCYAAMRELARLQTAVDPDTGYEMRYVAGSTDEILAGRMTKAPFDMVYLFDGHRTVNPLDQTLVENGIAPTVADVIVTQVDAVGGSDVTAHMANIHRHASVAGIDPGVALAGTVGAYSIVLPIYHLVEGWTHQLAQDVLDTLVPAEIDPATKVPLRLYTDRRGGQASADGRDEAALELQKAKADFTEFLEYIWSVGKRYNDIAQQTAVKAELDGLDAATWLKKMEPDIDSAQVNRVKQRVLRVLKADLTKKEVLRGEINEYYVDAEGGGGDDKSRAGAVRDEVRRQMLRLVGKELDDGRSEGGEFKSALEDYKRVNLDRFRTVMTNKLKDLMNGPQNESPLTARAGRLGYALAMLEAIRVHFYAAATALSGMESVGRAGGTQSRWFFASQEQQSLKSAGNALDEKPSGGNRKAYAQAAQRLVENHKAELTRRVAQEIADELVQVLDDLINSYKTWQHVLALRNEARGGLYALVVRGQNDNQSDRDESTRVKTRMVIDDQKFEGEQYFRYTGGQQRTGIASVLGEFTWNVKSDESGKLHLVCQLGDEPLRAEEGGGPKNTQKLLARCRQVFEGAWTDLSVMSYLVENYRDDSGPLVEVLATSNEPLLLVTDQRDTVKANFLRVHEQSRTDAETNFGTPNFLDTVLNGLAARLDLATTTTIRDEQGGDQQQQLVGISHSQDRFKLTFLFYRDVNQFPKIQSHDDGARQYRRIAQNRNQLHVFAAEQNAQHHEERLPALGQWAREFDQKVVMQLEDIDHFKLAARCLVYGNATHDWGDGHEGLLLYSHVPKENNPNNLKVYCLSAMPGGEDVVRRADGKLINKVTGKPVGPEHWDLTEQADVPGLLDAFDRFNYQGSDKTNPSREFKKGDYPRVRETLAGAMERDREDRVKSGRLYWQPPAGMSREQLKKAQGQVAMHLAYQDWLNDPKRMKLGEFRLETHGQPRSVQMQREADLWTLLYLVIQEETRRLADNIDSYGGTILPKSEQPQPPVVVTLTPPPPPLPPPQNPVTAGVCMNGHKMPADAQFCPRCGQPARPEQAVTARVCMNGHEMPADAQFCPKCGQLARPDEAATARLCVDGHEMPPDAQFCPKCGQPAAVR